MDETHNVEITNIESVPEWNPFSENTMNFQYTKNVIWLRARTSNETIKPGSILSFEWRVLDNIKLYFPNSNHSYTEFQTGDSYPKVSWAVPEGLNPSFRIPFHSAEKYFYIRLQSSSLISFPILLLNEKEFQNKTILETSVNWSLICICSIMFIISLFYALAFRMYAFLYYSIYVITHTLWYNTQYGNSFHSFWPYATWWQSKAILFFLSIGVATSFQFTRLFLQTKIRTPIADKILLLFALLGCFLAVTILFSDEYALLFKVIQLTYIVSIPFILLTGIRVFILGDKKIVFFLLSWGIYFVFGYISIFYYLGLTKYSLLVAYGPVFTFPIDFFFLLFNLFQKYQDLTLSRNNISERMFKLESQLSNRYSKSKLENIDYNHYIQKLELWMKESKPYLDEMMDLEKTAKAIGLNVQQTSELINAKLGQSFRSYVNSYRIDEAKRLLKNNSELTILSIAYTTGFGSKSSFNSEFKKTLGITPLEFRKKIQLD